MLQIFLKIFPGVSFLACIYHEDCSHHFGPSDICEKFLQKFVTQYKDGKAHGLTHLILHINIEQLNDYRKIYRQYTNMDENNRTYGPEWEKVVQCS